MRKQRPHAAPHDLSGRIHCCVSPREPAAESFDDGYGRIEVSTARRAEQCDEGSERGHCRSSVRQERNGHVTAAEAFRHDP